MSDTPTPYIKRDVAGSTGYECRECGQMYGDWFDRDCEHDYPRVQSDENVVPEMLKQYPIWTVWNGEVKQPLAPWLTGHLFPAKWGKNVEERPEAEFDRAEFVAEMGAGELEEAYSKTVTKWKGMDGDYNPRKEIVEPDDIRPTIILPHEERAQSPRIMLIDFDDVRQPGSGYVTPEVADIIDRLDAYTEVSSSGTGLHVFVRASLPDGVGRIIEDLETAGHVEMYDHARMVGCTWDHVEGAPVDVPDRQEVVDAIIDEYYDPSSSNGSRAWSDADADGFDADYGSEDVSAYYTAVDVRDVADTGTFGEFRKQSPGSEWQGPHPAHGSTSDAPMKSTNTHITPESGQWYCFAHRTGGYALSLIPVVEGWFECREECPDHMGKILRHDSMLMLKTCLAARDKYDPDDELEDETPPYAALRAVADIHDLPMDDPDEGILGSLTRKTAVTIYGEMEAGDVPLDD